MDLPKKYAHRTVGSMLAEHPHIGDILARNRIDCVSCGSSSCLLKNVVAQHSYDPQRSLQIEADINAYLAGLNDQDRE